MSTFGFKKEWVHKILSRGQKKIQNRSSVFFGMEDYGLKSIIIR